MGRPHVGTFDLAHSSVSGKNHNGRQVRFQGSVEVCEALNIQHVDFINEQHSRDQFSNAVINVLVNNLVDFNSELFCDFSFLRSVDLAH